MRHTGWWLLLGLLLLIGGTAQAQRIRDICPQNTIQSRPQTFTPGGLILTAFDSESLWVYDIDRDTRYQIPELTPCQAACRLSPDANWITYLNPETLVMSKMRLDGSGRTPLIGATSDLSWWSATPEIFLAWTPDHRVFLQQGSDAQGGFDSREYLPANGVISVQPGGRYALLLESTPDGFRRVVLNLQSRQDSMIPAGRAVLGPDINYYNGSAWSPDGRWLAYVSPGAFDDSTQTTGSEVYLLAPGSTLPQQQTFFSADYGAVRIGGETMTGLSWSPDSTRLAFWVIELTGPDPIANTQPAQLHVLDINTGQITRYCGFSTPAHTPVPPSLAWSPDSSHIAFGGDREGDSAGILLLALNVESGIFYQLSDGLSPFVGHPLVVAWGNRP